MTDAFFASLHATRIRDEISKAATDYGGRCEAWSFHSDVTFHADTNVKDRKWVAGLNELYFERNKDIAVRGWSGADGRIGVDNDNINGKFFMGSTWLAIPKEDPRLRCGTTQITGIDNMMTFPVRRRVSFDEPFIEQPKVAIFFRSLNVKMPDPQKDQAVRDLHLNVPEPGWRASIKCENIDLTGFDIVLSSYNRGAQADIDWVAHLAADPTVRSGSHSNSMMYRTSPYDCRCDFSDGPMPKSPDIIIRGWSEISVKSAEDLRCKHDHKDVGEKGFTWVTSDFGPNNTERLGGNWVAMMA